MHIHRVESSRYSISQVPHIYHFCVVGLLGAAKFQFRIFHQSCAFIVLRIFSRIFSRPNTVSTE